MHNPDIAESERKERMGLTHFAISVGSKHVRSKKTEKAIILSNIWNIIATYK
jgi:hypothetical protein